MQHQLTVIISFYNAQTTIETCLKSLMAQTTQAFDIILINDGSTDETEKRLLDDYQEWLNNQTYLKLDTNHGHAFAKNLGMKHVKTPYFMFLDADDWLAPRTIETYMKHMKNNDILATPIDAFDPSHTTTPIDTQTDRVEVKASQDMLQELIHRQTINSIVFKHEIITNNQLYFNENLNIYIELPFLVRYFAYVHQCSTLLGNGYYFSGEIIDPFDAYHLSARPFEVKLKDLATATQLAIQASSNTSIQQYLIRHFIQFIDTQLEPSQYDIASKYQYAKTIAPFLKAFNAHTFIKKKALFKLELFLISKGLIKGAYNVNRYRYRLRLLKNILLNKPSKHYAKYKLTDRPSKVKKDVIVFESFGGKSYSDNPKAIYDYMSKTYPELKYYWVFREPDNIPHIANAQKIKKGSKHYYDVFQKASVWVSNARLPLPLTKKHNQTYIQTWHGTPLKRLANDMNTVRMPNTTTALYKRNFYFATQRWDYLISPNPYSTEIFQSAFWMAPSQILEIGYPRNDITYNHAHDTQYHEHIRKKIGLPQHKKVLLYAPTWRDDEYDDIGKYTFELKINLPKLQATLGEDYVILLRMHYLIANAIDLNGYEGFAYDVSHYDDISELYLISDALITDYSSVMFDYGILKKPQFFFAYDIEKYDKNLRGFYIDYHKDLPGPIYTKADELIEGLKQLDQIQSQYASQIDAFYDRFCSIENGQASQFIGDMIYKEIMKK